jgi:hypothetical protein
MKSNLEKISAIYHLRADGMDALSCSKLGGGSLSGSGGWIGLKCGIMARATALDSGSFLSGRSKVTSAMLR